MAQSRLTSLALKTRIHISKLGEANGTVSILPFSRAGSKALVEHVREEGTHDLVGYHGSDPGEPALVPAGSIVVFSSTTFHRSGTNTSPGLRRVYLAQYSPEVILNKEGTQPKGFADPLLKDGRRVH